MTKSSDTGRWDSTFGAITLFVDDLTVTEDFYRRAFGTEPIHSDDDSVVFRIGGAVVNLLHERAAPELIDPAPTARASVGATAVYTLRVADADTVADALTAAGVELLLGPVDRWWGPRTVTFRDPSGHIWEVAGPAS